MTALHQKNTAMYDRLHKSVRLPFKASIESGVVKSDLPSVAAGATESQDDISTPLSETLSPVPNNLAGRFAVALKAAEIGEVEKVIKAEVASASAPFGAVAATASLSANGNIIVYLDSDQDITGDDGDVEIILEYRLK